jgi:hypothetical protein
MGGLIVLGLFTAAVVVFDLIAMTRGVDTRPGYRVDESLGRLSTR